MISLIKKVEARTYVHESEKEDKVLKALLEVFPFQEKIRKTEFEGSFNTKITLLEGEIRKNEEIEKFLENFQSKIANKLRKEELLKRIDRKTLFLRVDKQLAYSQAKIKIGNYDDCILLKVTFQNRNEIPKTFSFLIS